jgi:hypothetical protein
LSNAAFFRLTDGLNVTDRAIGIDKELHDDCALDFVVHSFVGISKGTIEEMRPGGVATGEDMEEMLFSLDH